LAVGIAAAVPAVAGDFVTDDSMLGGYECWATAAGGVAWEQSTGKWEGKAFRVSGERFKVRLLPKELVEVDNMGETEKAMGHMVMISKDGENAICLGEPPDGDLVSIIAANGVFGCGSMFGDFSMSLSKLRYKEFNTIGYLGEDDAGSATPRVTVGECRKVE
jgi:hypothetical protein